MKEALYTVRAIDGDFCDFVDDMATESLRYDGLRWDEAAELCRLSFKQGFQCVIWQTESGEDAGGNHEQPEEAVSKETI